MKNFDLFMKNPYWKRIYENAPSDECKGYYRIMFEYFSFETDEEDRAGIKNADPDDQLMNLMLSKEDAEYIEEWAETKLAKHQYRDVITWLFDGEKAAAVSASMFKGEIRNPHYAESGFDIDGDEQSISSGTACFLIKDDSLMTYEGEFWEYLRNEGFKPWGHHGIWNCSWVYVNVNTKQYAPGMPGIQITTPIVSKYPRNALSIEEFKTIWNILKEHEE